MVGRSVDYPPPTVDADLATAAGIAACLRQCQNGFLEKRSKIRQLQQLRDSVEKIVHSLELHYADIREEHTKFELMLGNAFEKGLPDFTDYVPPQAVEKQEPPPLSASARLCQLLTEAVNQHGAGGLGEGLQPASPDPISSAGVHLELQAPVFEEPAPRRSFEAIPTTEPSPATASLSSAKQPVSMVAVASRAKAAAAAAAADQHRQDEQQDHHPPRQQPVQQQQPQLSGQAHAQHGRRKMPQHSKTIQFKLEPSLPAEEESRTDQQRDSPQRLAHEQPAPAAAAPAAQRAKSTTDAVRKSQAHILALAGASHTAGMLLHESGNALVRRKHADEESRSSFATTSDSDSPVMRDVEERLRAANLAKKAASKESAGAVQSKTAGASQEAAEADEAQYKLPPGWESKVDPDSGYTYYLNRNRRITQWEWPDWSEEMAKQEALKKQAPERPQAAKQPVCEPKQQQQEAAKGAGGVKTAASAKSSGLKKAKTGNFEEMTLEEKAKALMERGKAQRKKARIARARTAADIGGNKAEDAEKDGPEETGQARANSQSRLQRSKTSQNVTRSVAKDSQSSAASPENSPRRDQAGVQPVAAARAVQQSATNATLQGLAEQRRRSSLVGSSPLALWNLAADLSSAVGETPMEFMGEGASFQNGSLRPGPQGGVAFSMPLAEGLLPAELTVELLEWHPDSSAFTEYCVFAAVRTVDPTASEPAPGQLMFTHLNDGNSVVVAVHDSAGRVLEKALAITQPEIMPGAWNHHAFVFAAKQIRWFVNAREVAAIELAFSPEWAVIGNSEKLNRGDETGLACFKRAAVFNRALTVEGLMTRVVATTGRAVVGAGAQQQQEAPWRPSVVAAPSGMPSSAAARALPPPPALPATPAMSRSATLVPKHAVGMMEHQAIARRASAGLLLPNSGAALSQTPLSSTAPALGGVGSVIDSEALQAAADAGRARWTALRQKFEVAAAFARPSQMPCGSASTPATGPAAPAGATAPAEGAARSASSVGPAERWLNLRRQHQVSAQLSALQGAPRGEAQAAAATPGLVPAAEASAPKAGQTGRWMGLRHQHAVAAQLGGHSPSAPRSSPRGGLSARLQGAGF
eukprot:TRINITY_DN10483_c0_g1_i8.p1 TRINITY_DN10483_c0_g1~~TRINITY_DN10483_c0_g1_i8.p1  ORF type:complete len:1095 (+),score=263.31 TRINITY_DN10483_c0_g1_i8:162-3446(+)